MNTNNDSAMVALLPTTDWWCKIDLPHTTLVYLGEISKLVPEIREELIEVVSNISILASPITLKVSGVQKFGDDDPVHVLALIPNPEIMAIRSFVEIYDTGEHPVFSPHATIGPIGSLEEQPPLVLSFDKILVAWGEDNQTFRLRNY